MAGKLDSETRQNMFQIYLASYKKFKYWFAIFYFISLVFWLLLYNADIAEALEIYKPMKVFLTKCNSLKFFVPPDSVINSRNIIDNLKNKLEYKQIDDGNWAKGVPQKNARQPSLILISADTLIQCTDSTFVTILNRFIENVRNDSSLVERQIARHDSLINLYTFEQPEQRKEVRLQFVRAINDLYRKDVAIELPIEQIAEYLLNKCSVPDEFSEETISVFDSTAKSIVDTVDKWKLKNFIDPQNFKVPLSFNDIKEYTLLVMVIIALFLQFHFVNFKFYERRFVDDSQKLMKVPSVNNIIKNLKVPLLSHERILNPILVLTYMFNLFFPIFVLYRIGKQVWNLLDSYTLSYLAIVIYGVIFIAISIYIVREYEILRLAKNRFLSWKMKIRKT